MVSISAFSQEFSSSVSSVHAKQGHSLLSLAYFLIIPLLHQYFLCHTLRLALLFYKQLRGDLENMGFEINPYNPCVANKMINGSQMTVTWHVDDLKISHKESDEVTKFIRELGQLYDNDLSVCRGNAHSDLGMHVDHSTSGTVKISMILYLKQIIDDFPEPVTSTAPTPAGDHLCTVRPDDERILLPE